MFRTLWETFRTQAFGNPTRGNTPAEQRVIDRERFDELTVEAWQSLNGLAATVWNFFQNANSPGGMQQSVDSYELDLLSGHQRLNRAIANLQLFEVDQATHLLAYSGGTLRHCAAVCQTLMDFRHGTIDLDHISQEELMQHVEQYLPARDIDILLRPRPPTPIDPAQIESRQQVITRRGLRNTL